MFGETAKKGAWPWQVAIYKNGRIICGGTLVSNRYVISAAHCFRQIVPRNYSIVLGEHNRKANEGTEQRVNVKRIVRHEDWREDGPHDIAVVELGANAIFTKYITPACLPRADEEVPVGTTCFMSGKIIFKCVLIFHIVSINRCLQKLKKRIGHFSGNQEKIQKGTRCSEITHYEIIYNHIYNSQYKQKLFC